MAEWSAEDNPYDVLGIPFGCSRDELKKKYRRLVLEKHPDKQRSNKRAADEFIRIQRAYEILTDDKAKEAFDALERARAARQAKQAGQTEKRRKMAEDLERRERAYEAERQQERQARNRLNEELARLRKEMADRRAAEEAARLRERVQASLAGGAQPSGQAGLEGEVQRTLKASWDPAASAYTEERLRGIFAAHGPVEDVILRQPKKRGKHSALVVMRDLRIMPPVFCHALAQRRLPAAGGGGGGGSGQRRHRKPAAGGAPGQGAGRRPAGERAAVGSDCRCRPLSRRRSASRHAACKPCTAVVATNCRTEDFSPTVLFIFAQQLAQRSRILFRFVTCRELMLLGA